jgi:hypothetical protein
MNIPFIPAPKFTRTNGRAIDVIVIHTIEAPERGDTAESCARYFQVTTRDVSAHYCIDSNSIVQCVRDKDVAWAAPGCNHDGIQLEHAGYARQSTSDWADDYSKRMLARSALLSADLAEKYDIPVRWLSVDDLKAGRRGFTSHNNVSLAFRRSDHTDPGRGFPHVKYLAMVRSEISDRPDPPDSPLVTREEWTWRRWYLGEGEFAEAGAHNNQARPDWIRERIPEEWWKRLVKFVQARQ